MSHPAFWHDRAFVASDVAALLSHIFHCRRPRPRCHGRNTLRPFHGEWRCPDFLFGGILVFLDIFHAPSIWPVILKGAKVLLEFITCQGVKDSYCNIPPLDSQTKLTRAWPEVFFLCFFFVFKDTSLYIKVNCIWCTFSLWQYFTSY